MKGQTHVSCELVIGPLFVMVPLEGDFEAGEEIVITRRGKSVARLVPELPNPNVTVNWNESPAVNRKRRYKSKRSADPSASILRDAGGKW